MKEWDSAMATRLGTCWVPGDGEAHDECFIGVFDVLADTTLGLAPEFDSGDGHPNDAGHALLFELCAVLFLCSQFYRASNAVIAPQLQADLSLSPESLGALSASFFYAFAITQVPLARLLDRRGRRS